MRTGQSNNAALVLTLMNCLATKGLQMTYKVKFFSTLHTPLFKFTNLGINTQVPIVTS